MRPYLYLRRWWRRTTSANRAMTSVALCVVVALVAWIFAPTGKDDVTSVRGVARGTAAGGNAGTAESGTANEAAGVAPAASGETAGDAVTGGTGGVTPAAAGGATAGGTGGTTSAAAGGASSAGGAGKAAGCVAAQSGTPGITDKTISVAAALVDLAGPIGNSAAGLGSADELARMTQAVAADINARGGLQCRNVTVKTYKVNPLSQDQQHAACLQIAQDRPFIAIDLGAFAFPQGAYDCIPQQKVPLVDALSVLPSELKRFSPYLSSVNSELGSAMRTLANGLKARGWFDASKGFKKLGLLYDDCSPEVNGYLDAALAKVGITSSQISKFVFQCPSGGFAPPNEIAQAATQHRLAGVTNVIPLTGQGSFNPYTSAAEGQGFRPKYAVNDYQGFILTQSGPLGSSVNRDNFDRAIAITQTRYGQEATPGIQQDAGTLRCQRVLVKAGFTPDYVFQKGGGIVCSQMWAVEAAVKHARALTREAALPGLFTAGTVQLSFPLADATYRSPLKLAAGDTWWPVEWHKEDGKFHVLDATRRPSWP